MDAICLQIVLEPTSRCREAVCRTYQAGGAVGMVVAGNSTVGLTWFYLRLDQLSYLRIGSGGRTLLLCWLKSRPRYLATVAAT